MSPRTGRPTNNPKNNRLELRLSDADAEKLKYCSKKENISRAEVLRKGLEEFYQKLKK